MKTKLAVLMIAVMVATLLTGCYQHFAPPTITKMQAFYEGAHLVEFRAEADVPCTFVWDTGDGGAAYGANPFYQYAESGAYDVTVTATNSAGQLSEVTMLVDVARYEVCFYENTRTTITRHCTYPVWGEL